MSNDKKPVTKPETDEAYQARLKAQARIAHSLFALLPEPEDNDEVDNDEVDEESGTY